MRLFHYALALVFIQLESFGNRRRRVPRRRLLAGTVALALIAGTAGVGAQAAPEEIDPETTDVLLAQAAANLASPLADLSDELQVTIGKTVSRTVTQKGDGTPFSMLLLNQQISGQGSGQVTIPMGPSGDKVIDVNSKAGEVQTKTSLGGIYTETLPVSVATEVTVNGETVDPDEGYNLTGDVEVKYVFTNHTSRMQEITFKNIDGQETSKEVEIPVPFGVSFTAPFGPGWDIVDAPNMAIVNNPKQTSLTSTVVLFPIIKDAVGGTTQTLTIKARAQDASLPATKSLAVPINLGTYQGGLALQVDPLLQKDLIAPAQSLLSEVLTPIIGAGQLISGFVGGFEQLNAKYLDPILSDIESIQIDPDALSSNIGDLATGLKAISVVEAANKTAQYRIAGLLDELAVIVGHQGVDVVDFLEKLIADVGPVSAQAAEGIEGLDKVMKSLDLEKLEADVATITPTCDVVAPTSLAYGFLPDMVNVKVLGITVSTIEMTPGDPGANAMAKVIADNTPGGLFPPPTPQWVKDLKTLQTQLNTQSNDTLLPSTIRGMVGALDPGTLPPIVDGIVQAPVCSSIDGLVQEISPYIGIWTKDIAPLVPDVIEGLNLIAKYYDSPEVAKIIEDLKFLLGEASKLISNPCTNAQVIDPILAAVNKYGLSGLESPAAIAFLLDQIFLVNGCGVAQIMRVLGDANGLIGELAGEFSQFATDLEGDVPAIVAAADGVKSLAGGVKTLLNTAPEQIQALLGDVEGAVVKLGGEGDAAIGDLSSYAAELGATLEAMNARALAGDGDPYGKAVGPNTQTITVYQITQEQAAPYEREWLVGVGLAILFLLLAVGLGTVLYRRRRAL